MPPIDVQPRLEGRNMTMMLAPLQPEVRAGGRLFECKKRGRSVLGGSVL